MNLDLDQLNEETEEGKRVGGEGGRGERDSTTDRERERERESQNAERELSDLGWKREQGARVGRVLVEECGGSEVLQREAPVCPAGALTMSCLTPPEPRPQTPSPPSPPAPPPIQPKTHWQAALH